MNQLASMMKWEFTLQFRYKIIHLSIASVLIYYLSLLAVPSMNTVSLQTTFLSFDSVLIGIMFVGAIVLFEKNENTLQALTVTPMKTINYFLSKIITLTVLSVISALLFLFLVHGFEFNYFYLLTGVILASVFLILLGFIMVSRCNSINEYLIMMMLAFVLLFIPPLLHLSGIYRNDIFYLWPTQASILLFQGVFGEVSLTDTIYAIAYLSCCIGLCLYLSKRAFYRYIIMGGK